MKLKSFLLLSMIFAAALPLIRAQEGQWQQGIDPGVVRAMFSQIKADIKNKYYDASFHGMDIDTRFKASDEQIKKATSLNQAFGIIAWTLESLNDSHTIFLPPPRPYHHEYGWKMQMIGDQCYVTSVRPGSDADERGLKPGDLVESINATAPTRDTLSKVQYLFNVLRPQPGLRLVVRAPDGGERTLDIAAKVKPGKRLLDFTGSNDFADFWNEVREYQNAARLWRRRSHEMGEALMIWKLPAFNLNEKGVDEMLGEARQHKALILDLRGNPGGNEDAVVRMVGSLFDHDVQVAEVKTRQKTKPLIAKTRGSRAFMGKLIVLVDSDSASASEILARVVQIEKRGTILGDRTSGSVMEAEIYDHQLGLDRLIFFGTEITHADLIMADGKSLEHRGVEPDELMLPTAADLANQRDPALARAAALAGVTLTPEEAGKLFPVEWRKD